MSMRKYGASSFKRPMTEEKEMSEVKRIAVQYDPICESLKLVECEGGELVKYEDYSALKAERDALAAENARMRIAINRTIGWQQSVDTENTESVRPLHELDTPATDAYANQLRAEGVEMFADNQIRVAERHDADNRPVWAEERRLSADQARDFAANLRKENGND